MISIGLLGYLSDLGLKGVGDTATVEAPSGPRNWRVERIGA